MKELSEVDRLRIWVYLLIGSLSVGIVAAKIIGVENVFEPSRYKPPADSSYGADRDANYIPKRVWPAQRPEPTPMFGSNDRSRWATVRALVEEGTYVIGKRENFREESGYRDEGIIFLDGYQSIDKVMNPDTGLFYSSKPPLFTTILAGEYFVLKQLFGCSIDRDRWWVVITILLSVNCLPFAIYLWLFAKLLEANFNCHFGKVFAFTVAAGATFVTTFSMTLNNHTPAVFCLMFALYPILAGGVPSRRGLFVAGLFAGLVASFELPALSFTVGLFLLACWQRGRIAWLYLLGALIPAVGFFTTNYLAIGQFSPAYGEFGGPWYDFPGSQWAKLKDPELRKTIGIDGADEPKWLYAFHLTLGHHGWFSLTPVWFVALVGLLANAWRSARGQSCSVNASETQTLRLFLLLTLAISAVVLGFFIYKTNNYGGFTSCARWLLWLTPMWLLALPATAEHWQKLILGRWALLAALLLSAFAVYYPAANPWRAPWILQLCELLGWIRY